MQVNDIDKLAGEVERLKKENERLKRDLRRSQSAETISEYLQLLDSIDTHVFHLETPEKYGLVNYSHAAFFGLKKADLEHRNIFDVLPEGEAQVCVDGNRRIFEEAKVVVTEEKLKRADGETRIFAYTKTPKLNERGETAYVVCTGEDITEKKKAERLLTFTQFTIDQAKMAVFWCHADGTFFYVNDTACEWLQYSFEELKQMHVADINPEFPKSGWQEHWEEIRSKGLVKMESVHRRKNGEVYPVEIFSNYVQFEGEEYKLAFVNDITEKVAAREAAEKSRMFLENVLESIQDGLCVLDPNLNILMANKVMREWYSGGGELLGMKCHHAFHECDTPCEVCPTQRSIATGQPDSEIIQGKSGSAVAWLEIFSYPIKDSQSGEVSCVVEFVRDITEKLKLERQLSQAQKMEAVGTLSGGIAHDFNNLLQMMLGSVQILIMQKSSDHPDLKYLDMLEKSISRAHDLTSRLLFLSRDMESDLKLVDLNSEVEHIVQLLVNTLPKMIAIKKEFQKPLKPIKADIIQIEQAVLNLAINSSQAMPDGGELSLQTSLVEVDEMLAKANPEFKPGQYIALTLSDTGSGMSQETMNHIYEPFFTTKPPGKGSGLGLSMVYGIVRNHGGVITCYSEKGVGTTFKLYFPVHEDFLMEETVQEKSPLVGGKETILVVDDEEALLFITCEILDKFGYNTMTACTGEIALQMIRDPDYRIDLVLLDINMPGMGGRKCLDEILLLPQPPPVILASGHAGNGLSGGGSKSGSEAFLGKPFQLNELIETVRTVLDSRRSQ